jgi:hypothetical protein
MCWAQHSYCSIAFNPQQQPALFVRLLALTHVTRNHTWHPRSLNRLQPLKACELLFISCVPVGLLQSSQAFREDGENNGQEEAISGKNAEDPEGHQVTQARKVDQARRHAQGDQIGQVRRNSATHNHKTQIATSPKVRVFPSAPC